jgi:hypothetical protein
LVVRGFDAFEDDVLAAELADLLLGLMAGALSDGEHGDHGGDAEDDAKGGEHGAQLVQPQALHPQRHRPPQVLGRGEEPEDGVAGGACER